MESILLGMMILAWFAWAGVMVLLGYYLTPAKYKKFLKQIFRIEG